MSTLIRQIPRSPSPVQSTAPQRENTTTRPRFLPGAPNAAREMLAWSQLLPATRRTSQRIGRSSQASQPLLPNVAPPRPAAPRVTTSRPAPRSAPPLATSHEVAAEQAATQLIESEKNSVEGADHSESKKSGLEGTNGETERPFNAASQAESEKRFNVASQSESEKKRFAIAGAPPTYAQALQETTNHKQLTVHAARLSLGRWPLTDLNASYERLMDCGWNTALGFAGGAVFWNAINPYTITIPPHYQVAALSAGWGYLVGVAYGALQEPSALESLLISDGVAKDRATAKKIIALLAKENVLQLRWLKSPSALIESASHLAETLSLDRAQSAALDRILWAMTRREQVPAALWQKLENAEDDVAKAEIWQKFLSQVSPTSLTNQRTLDTHQDMVKSLEDEIYSALHRESV